MNHPSVQSDDEYNYSADLGNVNVDSGTLTLNNTSAGDRKIQKIIVKPEATLRLTGSNTIETSFLTVDGTLERTDGVLLIKRNDENFKFEVNENGKLEMTGSSVLRFQSSRAFNERLTGKLDGVINAPTVEFYDSASLRGHGMVNARVVKLIKRNEVYPSIWMPNLHITGHLELPKDTTITATDTLIWETEETNALGQGTWVRGNHVIFKKMTSPIQFLKAGIIVLDPALANSNSENNIIDVLQTRTASIDDDLRRDILAERSDNIVEISKSISIINAVNDNEILTDNNVRSRSEDSVVTHVTNDGEISAVTPYTRNGAQTNFTENQVDGARLALKYLLNREIDPVIEPDKRPTKDVSLPIYESTNNQDLIAAARELFDAAYPPEPETPEEVPVNIQTAQNAASHVLGSYRAARLTNRFAQANVQHRLMSFVPIDEHGERDNLWFNLRHDNVTAEGADGYSDSDMNVTNYQLGYDRAISDSVIVGGYIGSTTGSVRTAGHKTDLKNAFNAGLYAGKTWSDGRFLQGLVHYGQMDNKIIGSSWKTKDYGVSLTYGQQHALTDSSTLTPYIGVDYDHLTSDAVTYMSENRVKVDAENRLDVLAGITYERKVNAKNTFRGDINYRKNISGTTRGVYNDIVLPESDDHSGVIDLSLGWNQSLNNRTQLDVDFGKTFGDYEGWHVQGKVSYRF